MRTTTPIFLACLLISTTAFAQNNRSFVSTTGNDANNCTAGNDCRSFTRAMAVTNPGGEIIALDSGGFGAFSIPKSVTVAAAPGVYAAITTSTSDAVEINATNTDRVVLRGLNITVSGFTGIQGNYYKSLLIERCTIEGGLDGLVISGGATNSQTTVIDTSATDAVSWAFEVINRATLIRCRGERSIGGLFVHDAPGISDAVVATTGFVAIGNTVGMTITCYTAGHSESLDIDHALVAHNAQDGIQADSNQGAVNVRVANSEVVENGGWGFEQMNSAYFGSTHTSMVAGNGLGDGTGSFSLIVPF